MKPLLDSIAAATPGARVLFLADPDDESELEAIERESIRGDLCVKVDNHGGNYAEKINRGVKLTREPFLLLGADDLHFHPGWFEAATAKLTDGIGVVGTQDLCNRRVLRGEHSTHSLITRDYAALGTIDEADKVLHEGYLHEFVDDEFVATARHRNAWAFAHDSVVEHLHPMAGKAPMDDLYAAQRQRMRSGRKLFERRKHLWT